MTIRSATFWLAAGPVLALVLAVAGSLALRRRVRWLPAVAGLAAAAGWTVVASIYPGASYSWRIVLWPRTMVDQSVLAAAGLAIASCWARSRWAAFAGVWFAAWWMARAGAAGPEFWRVLSGGAVAAWMLSRLGEREPGRAVASGLVLGGAGFLAGMEVWTAMGLVLASVAIGMRASGPGLVMPAGLSMVAIVGTEVGAGRLMRGSLGLMDFACLGALVAPGAVSWAEWRLRSLGRRGASWAAPVLVGGVLAGLALLATGLAGRLMAHVTR